MTWPLPARARVRARAGGEAVEFFATHNSFRIPDVTGVAGTTTPAAADPVVRQSELLARHRVEPDGAITATGPAGRPVGSR
ncbi:hypothetical protein GCM10010428_60460 [Actinosynnema pretiosum subsp. pretiosum]